MNLRSRSHILADFCSQDLPAKAPVKCRLLIDLPARVQVSGIDCELVIQPSPSASLMWHYSALRPPAPTWLIWMDFDETELRKRVYVDGIQVSGQEMGFTTLVYRQLWREGRAAVVKP